MLFALIGNLVLAAILIAGLVAPFLGMAMLKQRRKVLGTSLVPADRVDTGPTSVQGHAMPYHPMVAPFSGTPCVYCEALVERYSKSGHGKRSFAMWTEHGESTSAAPFYVEDDSGRVLVSTNGDDAVLDLPESFTYSNTSEMTGKVTKTTPEPMIQALEEMGLRAVDEHGQTLPLKFTERIIAAGSNVFVLGRCSRERVDIDRATGGDTDHEGDSPIQVLTGTDKDQSYVSTGSREQVPGKLLKRAILCVLLGPIVAAGAAGLFYLIYS